MPRFIFLFMLSLLLLYGAFVAGYTIRPFFSYRNPPITIEKLPDKDYKDFTAKTRESQVPQNIATLAEATAGKLFVASVNSTIYHLNWCSGAKRIAAKNKIFFETRKQAEEAGYNPASNCKEIDLFKK